jgi:hypothetical protein
MRHHTPVARPDHAIEQPFEQEPPDGQFVTVEGLAAAEAFVNGRLAANKSWEVEVRLSPPEQRHLAQALSRPSRRPRRVRSYCGCVVRRPRRRQHGARGRGRGSRRRARDGDDGGGGGDPDRDPPRSLRHQAQHRHLGVGGWTDCGDGGADA